MASRFLPLPLAVLIVLAALGGALVVAAPPVAAVQCGSVGSSCCTTAVQCLPVCQGSTATSCVPTVQCSEVDEDVGLAGVTEDCGHVSGYVCIVDWYGGHGLVGGFTCDEKVYLP